MAKQGAAKATPKLRFSEFVGEEWGCVPADKLFDQISNRDAEAGLPILAITQEHGAIPRELIGYHVSVTEKSIESYKVVERGDFIISLRSFQGGIEYSHYRGVCSPVYVILRRKGEGFSQYFKHLFKSARFIRQLTRNIEGLRDGKMISYKQFSDQLITIPNPAEQNKIANCLTSLDEVIAAQGRKVEALKAHKRGLMQQLFPREGETRPRLRFPEFRNSQKWIDCKLGDIAGITKGKGISKADIASDGITTCVRYGELYTIYGEVIDHVRSRTNVPIMDLVLSEAGDVIIPASGETKEDIATCSVVLKNGVALGGDLNIVRSDIDGRFFSYYLNGSKRRALARVAQGDSVVHLYPHQLERLQISVPANKLEQQRIADCLSSLDAQITAESNQLAAVKTHKQGLMQQLFPAPDVATA